MLRVPNINRSRAPEPQRSRSRNPQPPRGRSGKRSFAAAEGNRFNQGWKGSAFGFGNDIRSGLAIMRGRSRSLANNDDYMRGFLRHLVSNVVGPTGAKLQSRPLNPDGKRDIETAEAIEAAWKDWCHSDNCTLTGQKNFKSVQRQALRFVARDGEFLIRKVIGADNDFGFALEIIAIDLLDIQLNKVLPNGSAIRMGVEFADDGRPIAYHLLKVDPARMNGGFYGSARGHLRVPAEEIIHLKLDEQETNQARGVPWAHTAMNRLYQLGEYEKAELLAARMGASKLGFYTSSGDENSEEYEDLVALYEDLGKPLEEELEPGTMGMLPPGMKAEAFDLQHPMSQFPDFLKAMLRGASTGLGESYNSFSGDLTGVNYSSMRFGALVDRRQYQEIQDWLDEEMIDLVYRAFLFQQLYRGTISVRGRALRLSNFKTLRNSRWQWPGFEWVDPLKQAQANSIDLEKGLTSRTQIARKLGIDHEDILKELAEENRLAAELGVVISDPVMITLAPEEKEET